MFCQLFEVQIREKKGVEILDVNTEGGFTGCKCRLLVHVSTADLTGRM